MKKEGAQKVARGVACSNRRRLRHDDGRDGRDGHPNPRIPSDSPTRRRNEGGMRGSEG